MNTTNSLDPLDQRSPLATKHRPLALYLRRQPYLQMKIKLLHLFSYLLWLLLPGCSEEGKHPIGIYVSTCIIENGSPEDGYLIFDVGKDTIKVRQLNDFLFGTPYNGIALPTTIFSNPHYSEYDPGFADTTTATITEQELTIKSKGISNSLTVAKRFDEVNSSKVNLADNRMVANKVFERWSDRSRWVFSTDNRLEVRGYDNKALYDFEHAQFYTIDSFASFRFLNIHPHHRQKYIINAISDSYIALERVGCVPKHDTLRFVKDTLIEPVLPLVAVLAEQPEYRPKTYSTYWYETLWTFTFMNEGTFKYLPNGHFSSGHLYTGTFTEQKGIIDFNYAKSDFGNTRGASDPVRLFRLDENHLRWPNGALITWDGIEDKNWEDLFYEFVDVCSQMVAENKFGVSDEPYPYISANIIAVHPEVLVEFKPNLRQNSKIDPQSADTLSLAEMREKYPYEAPDY